jgi:peptide deformylase
MKMAIRNIVKHGDDVLTKKCRKVEVFDQRLSDLIDDLFDTLYESGGVGLAAPQVGVLKRIAVIDIDGDPIELVNPEIVETDGEQYGTEGCLSYPGQFGMVRRPMYVKIKAQDRKGDWYEYEGEELLARAFCHETEHLDGNMFMRLVEEWVEVEQD